MFNLKEVLAKASETQYGLCVDEMEYLLNLKDEESLRLLYKAARDIKLREYGCGISVRGLVEASNVCAKDCLYCGIRKSNLSVDRYTLSSDEIYEAAEEAKRLGYASLVIQSGEIESDKHTDFIESVLNRLQCLNLGITLSLGEQKKEVFARWRNAGASRYLLRIESSNKSLYESLHPSECIWERRVNCLHDLKDLGYQLGTGVMCAIPNQTMRDLANDIKFFKDVKADMIGMGPYIPHPSTPLKGDNLSNAERLEMGIKMIAVTRLYLHNVNIASSTALQALASDGRERGILAGANVLMPNVTSTRWRKAYQLYEGKPSINEQSEKLRNDLDKNLAEIGEKLLYNQLGDSHTV